MANHQHTRTKLYLDFVINKCHGFLWTLDIASSSDSDPYFLLLSLFLLFTTSYQDVFCSGPGLCSCRKRDWGITDTQQPADPQRKIKVAAVGARSTVWDQRLPAYNVALTALYNIHVAVLCGSPHSATMQCTVLCSSFVHCRYRIHFTVADRNCQ